MALITKALLRYDYFLEIMTHTSYQIPPTNKVDTTRYLAQQHAMLNKVKDRTIYREDVIGGKTGYTDQARNTLVTIAKEGDIELIVVLLKGSLSGNYQDTATLLDYGFSSYQTLELHKKSDVVATLPVYTVKSGELYQYGTSTISVPEEQSILAKKDTKAREITTNLLLPEYVTLGVCVGDVVGKIQYLDGTKIIAENDLIVSNLTPQAAPSKTTVPSLPQGIKVAQKLFLVALGILLIFLIWLIIKRLKRRKRYKERYHLKIRP
jgi:D-alanyl-D-alanine carboxypeptidase